jgi:hypothetical protein
MINLKFFLIGLWTGKQTTRWGNGDRYLPNLVCFESIGDIH